MNLKGEPAFVGRYCGGNEYAMDRATVDFYSDALDDHSALYQRFAPPLLHHSECYKFVGEWYLKNLFGNLHARQDWEFFEPIQVGARVRTRSTIIERYHKRGRDYVVNETELRDCASDHLLVRGRTHQSFLPPGTALRKKSGDEAQRSKPASGRPPFPATRGTALEAVTKTIDQRRCWMFSGPGRNYHTDQGEAIKLGFPNIVVQGMMTTCFAAEVMQNTFAEGFLGGGRMSLKLTDVVWVDETLRACGQIRERQPEGTRSRVYCDLWVEKLSGARVLIGEASALE